MRRKTKRFLASVLAFTMAFSMAGTQALAAGVEGKITPSQSVEEVVTTEEVQEPETQEPEVQAAPAQELEASETEATEELKPEEEKPEEIKPEEEAQESGSDAEKIDVVFRDDAFLAEGFEDGIPESWTQEEGEIQENYSWTTAAGDHYGGAAHGGELNALYYAGTYTADEWLITPEMDLSSANAAVLNFWYTNRVWSPDIDDLYVYYRIGGGDWAEIFSTTENHEEWTEVKKYLPKAAMASNVQIGFYVVGDYGYGVALDDVTVYPYAGEIPTHTLTYNANGGNGVMADENSPYDEGALVTALENQFTAPEGMYFDGWNTDPNGNGTSYAPGDTISIAEDITLYAIWSTEEVVFEAHFNSGLPEGWSAESENDSFTWLQGAGDYFLTEAENGAGSAWLISQTVDLSQYNSAILEFNYANVYNEGEVDFFVYYRVDEGKWMPLYLATENTNSNWYWYELLLPDAAMTENVQFGFQSVSSGENNYNVIGPTYLVGSSRTDLYEINVTNMDKGYVMLNQYYGEEGDEISFTINPIEPYVFDGLSITCGNEDIEYSEENGTYTFTMPAGDVLINWQYAATTYVVNISEDIEHGTVTATPAFGDAGTTITLTVTPATAYGLDELIVTCDGEEIDLAIEDDTYTFEMPEGNVEVYATFEQYAYIVIISDDIEGGTVTATPAFADAGTTITLTVTPATGYELDELIVTCDGANVPVTSANGAYTFVMPEGDVVVTAIFAEMEEIFFEDFEHDGDLPEGWTFIDADGDENNWAIWDSSQNDVHSGSYALSSESYINNVGAMTPDNWAITPAITIPADALLSFWINGQDADWAAEHMQVYVGAEPTVDAMINHPLSEELIATGDFEQYVFSLDGYKGETVYIGFRHYNVTDQFRLNLEDVAVYSTGEVEKDPVKMHYAKAALDGKLGLAFFVEIPDWLKDQANAYVTFEQNGETKQKSVADIVAAGVNSDGLYRVVTYMPAAYYRYDVTLRFYDNLGRAVTMQGSSSGTDLTENGINYTLQKYAASIIANGSGSEKALAQAMDNYCTAAQINFGHVPEGLTITLSDDINNVTAEELEEYKAVKVGERTSKISGISLGASFDNANTIKIGLTFAGSGKKPSSVKYYVSEDGTFENAVATTLHGTKAKGYYLSVSNIPAVNLDKNYTFFIVDEATNQTYSITCSVYTYVRATAFSNNASADLQNMVKALYLYGKAAKAYFTPVATATVH